MIKNIFYFRNKYSNNFIQISNYLFILYAFLLPISFSSAVIVFNVIFIFFLLSGDIKNKLLFALKSKVVQALLLFYIMNLLWLFSSEHIDAALWRIERLNYFLFVIIYIIMIKEEFKEKILSSFIVAIIISELISTAMILNINIPFIKITGITDYVPFFYSYTQYTLLISISLGLVLFKLLTYKLHLYEKIIYSLFFILSSVNIFVLQSKLGYGLYIFSIITTILFIYKHNVKKIKLSYIVIVIITTYLIAFNYSHNFKNQITAMKTETINIFEKEKYSGSTGVRIAINVFSYPIIKENFFFGVGSMNHIYEVRDSITNSNLSSKEKKAIMKPFVTEPLSPYSHLHNEFLEVLLQFGIIGLLLFLNIFYAIIKEKSTNIHFSMLKNLLLVNLFLYSWVSHFFVFPPLTSIFIFLVTLSLPTYDSTQAELSNVNKEYK